MLSSNKYLSRNIFNQLITLRVPGASIATFLSVSVCVSLCICQAHSSQGHCKYRWSHNWALYIRFVTMCVSGSHTSDAINGRKCKDT